MQKTKTITALDVAVTEALTLLMTARTVDYDRLICQLTVATNALDQFVIKGKVHPAAPLETLYSAAESFTSPTGLMIAASGNLTTLAAAATGSFAMDIGGYYEIKIYAASGNVAGSVVDIFAGLR